MAALIDIMLRDHLPEYEVKYGSSSLPVPTAQVEIKN